VGSGFVHLIYWILAVITAVVHFTNVLHINQRLVFWYHFTFDCSGPFLFGVFLALILTVLNCSSYFVILLLLLLG
jgi:hypothetical protein